MGTSEDPQFSEWERMVKERREKELRRQKCFSCFALFVVILSLAIVASVVSLIILGVIEVTHYLWRPEFLPVFLLKKEKTEGKPPVHDQPERRSIIWIDSFTLKLQDEDIDPINSIRVGLAHPSLMGSTLRWNRMNTSSTISNLV